MTVQELHIRLETIMKANSQSKNYIVGSIDKSFKGLGGNKIFPLSGANSGIDWNAGKVFLYFEDESIM